MLPALSRAFPAPAANAAIGATSILRRSAPLLVVAGALVVWAASLPAIDQRAMTDLGLVSVLPATTLGALVAVALSFCVQLRNGARPAILLVHVLALILMLYGITPLIDEVPRYTVTWRHLGIAEAIHRSGAVDPRIDAYFNWPGFFILSAFVTELADLPRGFVDWSPVFYNVLYLAPLLAIFRTATDDARLAWGGVWLFYLTNWIGQDYYSPQGLMYFVYLVVIAVLLRWFVVPGRRLAVEKLLFRLPVIRRFRPVAPAPRAAPADVLTPRARAGLMGVLIVLVAAIVATHQLTPFVLVFTVGALVVFKRLPAPSLPVLFVVLIGSWMAFMAVTYLGGHLEALTGGVGKVDEAASANVGSRLHGSREHVLVVYIRLLLTAGVWGLAALGAVRAFFARRPIFLYLVLAGAAFPLLPIQPYGGEMLMRVYLFALPFMALLAAMFFFPTNAAGRSRWMSALFAVVSLGLLGTLLLARYGNERMDFYTKNEFSAVERLYQVTHPGDLLIAGSGNTPWKYRDYENYDYEVIAEPREWNPIDYNRPNISRVLANLNRLAGSRKRTDVFVIITRSQKAEVDLMGLSVPGFLDRVENAIAASPTFKLVYRNRDAEIFRRAVPRRHG